MTSLTLCEYCEKRLYKTTIVSAGPGIIGIPTYCRTVYAGIFSEMTIC